MLRNHRQYHIVFGGGAAYVLGHVGAYFALLVANLGPFASIGGASAGSIKALTAGANIDPEGLIKIYTGFRFNDVFARNTSGYGLLTTDPLGNLVADLVPAWPENFWACAVTDRASTVCFTADGVYEQNWSGGSWHKLLDEPVPTRFAVQASCTLHGVVLLELLGRKLRDGGYGPHGVCPVGLVSELYGARAEEIIGVDIFPATGVCPNAIKLVGKLGSKVRTQRPRSLSAAQSALIIRPDLNRMNRVGISLPALGRVSATVPHLGLVRFNMGVEHKQAVILDAFRSTVRQLDQARLLSGDERKLAYKAGQSFAAMLAITSSQHAAPA